MEIKLKELLLAGIGTIAYTYDKAEVIVNDLVKRGEIAVKDGKELNEELKRKTKCKPEDAPLSAELLKSTLADLNLATKQDIDELKKRIDELEKKQ
jgi:polyhydroxyalkanoate synthesis regulator phasin